MNLAPGWEKDAGGKSISKCYAFASYAEGLAFVNKAAALAIAEDHHPDIELLYKKVKVRYTTHSAGGLSDLDFSCAAKLEALVV